MRLWIGRALTAIVALFLFVDAGMKVAQMAPAMQGTLELGYPQSAVFGIGVVELLCLVVYLTPATSVLGAILLTGYLGGAVATHVRIGNPLFTHILFPTYVGLLIWGGLVLRDSRVQALLPWEKR